MSRPRSPLHSRTSALPGRIADGSYGEQYHSSVHSATWRTPENDSKVQGATHWNNAPTQGEEEVDHWAKFIEAIGHAGKRRPSPMSRYHIQGDVQSFEEKPSHSPRRLPRERLSSPETLPYGTETHQRIPSPGQRKNEPDFIHLDRHFSRDSSPRHSQGKRWDRMGHGYLNEGREDRYLERSSFSERSLQSKYREHHPHPKRFRDLDPQHEYSVSHRGLSAHSAPLIVEHDHGIPKRDVRSRDIARSRDALRNREHPRIKPRNNDMPRERDPPETEELQRGRDCTRRSESSRSREPFKHRRDHDHYVGMSQNRHGSLVKYHVQEETRMHHSSVERGSPMRRSRHAKEPQRMEPHLREPHGQRAIDLNSDVDLRGDSMARVSGRAWEKEVEMHAGGNHGGVLGQGRNSKGTAQIRNQNAAPMARMDLSEHETLRIKVDMSRPVGQSSHVGYSSERQLSLDLVNVGRQRLDFLPLLKHSGTYHESAIHSGTFAQEIITLVHQVKENYFQGQGITLNERFSNEQHYSIMDEDEFTVEGQEQKEMGPKINKPLGITSLDTQIFCKIGSLQVGQAQKRRQITDPGDLRHDLERRRQQRLGGVKVTIAGNFSQMVSQGQEIESTYVEEENPREAENDLDWSEQIDGDQKLPARQNFKRFKNRLRRQIRNNPNNGASW